MMKNLVAELLDQYEEGDLVEDDGHQEEQWEAKEKEQIADWLREFLVRDKEGM